MSEPAARRMPGLGALIAIALLVLPIGAVAWWLNRSKSDGNGSGSALTDLDVVCLGRIDGLAPVVALEPAIPGKVKMVVAEGPVKAGTELLRLDDSRLQLRVEEAQAAVAAAEVDVKAAKLEQSLLPQRKMTQQAAVQAAAERVVASRKLYEEKMAARKFGTVTAAELLAAEAEMKQLEQLETAEKARLTELGAAEDGHKLKVEAAEIKKTLADIAQRQAQQAIKDCVLLAPSDGVVLRVQTSVGESVAPGTPLIPLLFRPEGPLVVRADLEQEFIGRVKKGMSATVKDEARSDSPAWNGKVHSVGQLVARKRSILLEPGEMNDVRTVECIVILDGNTEGLLVGQRMQVRIAR